MDFNVDTGSQIVYVVTADGYNQLYGSEIYLIGAYSSRVDAESVQSRYNKNGAKVTAVILDQEYPLIFKNKIGIYANENYLGGYIE